MTFPIILIAAALYYLGSRAKITSFAWSRYPLWLASFMDCAACTGFWYGLALAIVFGLVGKNPTYFELPIDRPWAWPFVGLASIVTTAIVAATMQYALDYLGIAVPVDTESQKQQWQKPE